MKFRLRIIAGLLCLTGCGAQTVPSGASTRTPPPAASTVTAPPEAASPTGPAAVVPSATLSATLPVTPPASSSSSGSGDYLIVQRNDGIFRMSLLDPKAELERLFSAGVEALADPRGRYVAALGTADVKIYSLKTRKQVAAVPGGDYVAFRSDDTAVVAQRSAPPRFEDDCHRPTTLLEVNLRDGTLREIYRSPDFVRPFAATAKKAVITVPNGGSCETSSVQLLDLASRRSVQLGADASVNAADQDVTRVLVQFPRNQQYAHGYNVLFDNQGKRRATLPYHVDSAAYSPQQRLLYNEQIFDEEGFTTDSRIHLGGQDPNTSDRVKRLRNEGQLVWSTTGDGFSLRLPDAEQPDRLQAAHCATPALECRRLPLTWTDEITLLLVVPAAAVTP